MNRLKAMALTANLPIDINNDLGYEVAYRTTFGRQGGEYKHAWGPETNKADCFSLLEELQRRGALSIHHENENKVTLFGPGFDDGISATGETLQESICNLAVKMAEELAGTINIYIKTEDTP